MSCPCKPVWLKSYVQHKGLVKKLCPIQNYTKVTYSSKKFKQEISIMSFSIFFNLSKHLEICKRLTIIISVISRKINLFVFVQKQQGSTLLWLCLTFSLLRMKGGCFGVGSRVRYLKLIWKNDLFLFSVYKAFKITCMNTINTLKILTSHHYRITWYESH